MDPAGIEPASPVRQAGVFPLDHGPIGTVETMGIEPIQSACEAPSPPWHMRPQQLRRPDSHRRRTAYETVLELLQSTPQYSRQDSNLRPPDVSRAPSPLGHGSIAQ